MEAGRCILKKALLFVPLLLKQNGKMNTLQLPDKWINYLLNLPETGMGYQVVNVVLKNGKVLHKKKVINSSILILPQNEKIKKEEIVKIETD